MSMNRNKSPHRVQQEETSSCIQRPVGSFAKGDVFVRNGGPFMRTEIQLMLSASAASNVLEPNQGRVWIIGLGNGSCFSVHEDEMVYPATDVVLGYKTSRRGE